MSQNLLVVVGSGPGIGLSTASLFASHGFSIALISRNAERLQSDVAAVKKSVSPSSTIKAYSTNVGDSSALSSTLSQIQSELGTPEVVLFNVARIQSSTIGQEPVRNIRGDFESMNVGLYVTATWALPLMEDRAKGRGKGPWPSFLLSGGFVAEDPRETVFALSMQKAMQHNLMKSLWRVQMHKKTEEGPVHFGVSNIGGHVGDEEPVRTASNIAGVHWELYGEERQNWRQQVDIGVEKK
ncbi:NAD(P)-binding protein [Viridothelium virens]|uniref:NAD(P)-binding protein n=1 Tax=Viridothelium virens TaxID=1048519 RepID=A0A6A6H852_VIRVR|nr:NAD(P)-binding protein [Viridothelium virens]